MLARAPMPAVRQKRSKLAPTSCQASSTIATGTTVADVLDSFMALLSFVDSAPRAYWLKVSNARPPISTSTGTSPSTRWRRIVSNAEINSPAATFLVRDVREVVDRLPIINVLFYRRDSAGEGGSGVFLLGDS